MIAVMHSHSEFKPQQVLSGQRLRLQPVQATDFDALFSVASDPLIWEQHPQSNRYERHIFTDYFESALTSGSAYVIIDKATETVIGSSRYDNPNTERGTIEIGWTFLARSYWGGSYNAELKDIMLQFAWRSFREVHFCIGEQNYRSQSAIKKLGAQLGNYRDTSRPGNVFFALTEEQYLGLTNYGKQETLSNN